jgi:hypothetical protein
MESSTSSSLSISRSDITNYISSKSPNFRIFKEELGIELDPSKTIRLSSEGISAHLKDGRLAKLALENDILLEVSRAIGAL